MIGIIDPVAVTFTFSRWKQTRRDETRQDKTRQDKTRPIKPNQAGYAPQFHGQGLRCDLLAEFAVSKKG